MKKLLFVITIILVLTMPTVASAASEGGVYLEQDKTFYEYFPDRKLAEAVASNLKMQPDEAVSKSSLKKVVLLLCWKRGVESLEGISNLENLKGLDLEDNYVTEIPDELAELNLSNLNLKNNPIKELPDFLGNFDLEILYLNKLNLTEIPEFIGRLSKLRELDLANNKITEIPEFVGTLPKLESLNLDYNQISEIPEYMGNVKTLKYIYLNSNKISHIPDSLVDLPLITNLRLNGNPLSEITENFKNKIMEGKYYSTQFVSLEYSSEDVRAITPNSPVSAVLPKILVQFYEITNASHGTAQIKNVETGRSKTYSIRELLTNSSQVETILMEPGAYYVKVYTGNVSFMLPEYNYWHINEFDYYVEVISEPEIREYKIPFSGGAVTDDGKYDVTYSGLLQAEFSEGENVLDADQLSNITLRGLAKDSTGTVEVWGQARIIGGTVQVENGAMKDMVLYANIKTTTSERDRLTAVIPGIQKSGELYCVSGNSAQDQYWISINGVLPSDGLSEGINTLGINKIDNLQLTGVAYNMVTGEVKAANKSQISSMKITVKNGEVTEVTITGKMTTPTGTLENFNITSKY